MMYQSSRRKKTIIKTQHINIFHISTLIGLRRAMIFILEVISKHATYVSLTQWVAVTNHLGVINVEPQT